MAGRLAWVHCARTGKYTLLMVHQKRGTKAMEAMGTDNALTVIVGLVASLIAGLAWGVFNGLCITKLRVPALITTLGSLGAALGIARLITATRT